MELKEGMYVRTKNGIGRVTEFTKHESWGYIVKVLGQYSCYTHTSNGELSDVIKASENIIDLIEEDDLLSIEYYSPRYEERVTRLFEVDYRHNEYLRLKNAYCDFMLVNNEFRETDRSLEPIIKSIVTKEVFKANEYRVEAN